MFPDIRLKSLPFKHITDSVDKTIVNFICRDTSSKMKEFLDNMTANKKENYFNFSGGVSEILNKEQKIEKVITSLRDFVKQEKKQLISAFALSLLENLDVYYSSFVGNGSWVKLFIFGHFRQIDADFYELKSMLKEISEKEDPRKRLLRKFPQFSVCRHDEKINTWKDVIVTTAKPIKYTCGLAFRPVKYICSLVSQIFWQGTQEAEVKYQACVRVERNALILDWLKTDLDS